MFNLKSYIRIVFFSLMSLPLIIFFYFIINFSQQPNDMTFKNIAWPDKGLITLWFDDIFFIQNKKYIMDLMNKYHFSGVISLSNNKPWHSRSLSRYQLIMLQNSGWEITNTNLLPHVSGQHKINEMPTSRGQHLAVYDMSSGGDNIALATFLKKTNVRNGWIVLYFHKNMSSPEKKPISTAKLNRILQIVKQSEIPVVIQEQVLRVSL